ncbi:MAG: glycine cleavage system protein GcvH [Verrucomicrobiae bacterium]|nr:glycine cleavage system protein GcvH [Verrucomicrobiae bacterium]
MDTPENIRFAESHEWITIGTDPATVGISDHAQSELGEVVYVELPEVGKMVDAQDPVAVIESVKAASDVYAPVGGEIVAVNDSVAENTSLINSSPYDKGWLFKIKPSNSSDFDSLLDAEAYQEVID